MSAHLITQTESFSLVYSKALPLATTQFECTNCGPHVWEIVAAIGASLTVILAFVALVIARSSKDQAKRSAIAAESSASAASDSAVALEHLKNSIISEVGHHVSERARRPELTGSYRVDGQESMTVPIKGSVTHIKLRIGVHNHGDLDADDAIVNILYPQNLADLSHPCDASGASVVDKRNWSKDWTSKKLDQPRADEGTDYWNKKLDFIEGEHVVMYLRVPIAQAQPHNFIFSVSWKGDDLINDPITINVTKADSESS